MEMGRMSDISYAVRQTSRWRSNTWFIWVSFIPSQKSEVDMRTSRSRIRRHHHVIGSSKGSAFRTDSREWVRPRWHFNNARNLGEASLFSSSMNESGPLFQTLSRKALHMMRWFLGGVHPEPEQFWSIVSNRMPNKNARPPEIDYLSQLIMRRFNKLKKPLKA